MTKTTTTPAERRADELLLRGDERARYIAIATTGACACGATDIRYETDICQHARRCVPVVEPVEPALAVGQRFIERETRPWSGPCRTCGRRKARHYATVEGRRRLVTCPTHAEHCGVERRTNLCEITGLREGGVEYRVEQILDVTDELPGRGRVQASDITGGITRRYFAERVAAGTIELDVTAYGYPTRHADGLFRCELCGAPTPNPKTCDACADWIYTSTGQAG